MARANNGAENATHHMNHPDAVEVDLFLARHLNPAPGRAAQDIEDRILYWISVANDPALTVNNTNPQAMSDARRKARQNARRLAKRHPDAAAAIDAHAGVTR